MFKSNGKKAHNILFRSRSKVTGGGGLFFRSRLRFLSAILLLVVLSCSGNGILHELWHIQPESCENTAHSCRNERLGVQGDAWQQPVHEVANFHIPAFNCPVCSGLIDGVAETAFTDYQCKVLIVEHSIADHEEWLQSADIKIPSPRGHPAVLA